MSSFACDDNADEYDDSASVAAAYRHYSDLKLLSIDPVNVQYKKMKSFQQQKYFNK